VQNQNAAMRIAFSAPQAQRRFIIG